MRVVLLTCVVFGFTASCERRQEASATQIQPATSQSTAWEPPVGSLDAIFAEIVRTDWQTAGQWEPRSPKPPLDFIARVREEAEFRRLDLDGDGTDERIICLNHSPGQKAINQTFYVAQKTEHRWVLVGKMEGEPRTTTEMPRSGMQPLDATWYNGGFEYTTTRYDFKDGRYVAGASKRWHRGDGS